ncbi:1-aminocyclopropane-1-carboxylate deaminase/D-cysteine desulfhydrase [Chryseobacterium aquaticum]|uniref:1-aminocyclopropane-1-carboxylate deaminase/D-cysteine desulfhydrase n=1 Tax=Chryseobacterium aquaticum TaxID=452084 RepID=A0A848N759_9FLAO|nr:MULTISPECIES: pyridoxal-phosphate dependent enzyme [Chryseobacterium]NMR34588.1 1-aminocyclopropane-1-carboxylate deaminase/D-cysteine desulfhydrase [Chryseobacterium aquaticum]NRQ46427.1 1-aminocyclopropane-1-carboxylate deaminase/D-cysteine desulfhydrase [Chryseobacterium sp. C-204]
MLLKVPKENVPIQEISVNKNIRLFIKREDLVHPEISGNKYWKLFFNINNYLERNPQSPLIITFGGAFSNHISAVSALGKLSEIPTLGIIRGEELEKKWTHNPTLVFAKRNGVNLKFVTREEYRHKEKLTEFLQDEFPDALIIPEGGTNKNAVQGIKMMMNDDTKDFDYLCTAVGTGGTVAGISEFCEENQKVMGFKVVEDASLENRISELTSKRNFHLIDAAFGGYGKINDDNVRFINDFKAKYDIPLEPIYTGKMMQKVFEMIEENYFPEGSKILCFHTGGLQGIEGANMLLEKQNRNLII